MRAKETFTSQQYIPREKIKVKNVARGAKILTNVQTFQDCALHQWNVRYELSHVSYNSI